MNNGIEIPVNINISDKDIERLEKTKKLLEEIKEMNNDVIMTNILNVDKDSILVFKTGMMLKAESQKKIEEALSEQFGMKCKLISDIMSLDKIIAVDYAKGKDYITTTYYDTNGNPIKEETIQYK